MSAHPLPHRRGWLSLLAAQVADFVFEPVEETDEPVPVELQPHPVVAVVSAARRSGASTVARLLAAELAARGEGAAVVTGARSARRTAPPSRSAVRLGTALAGVGRMQPCGRLVLAVAADARRADARGAGTDPDSAEEPRVALASTETLVNAARYLAPVVLDIPADGSAASLAPLADHVAVVAGAGCEPPLLDAVATVIGGEPLKVANRIVEPAAWTDRVDLLIPDSRIAARGAVMGTRPLGPLGVAIGALADALGPAS